MVRAMAPSAAKELRKAARDREEAAAELDAIEQQCLEERGAP